MNALEAAKAGMRYMNTTLLGIAERSGITSMTALLYNLFIDKEYEKLDGYHLRGSYPINVLMADKLRKLIPGKEPVSLTNRTHTAGVHAKAVVNNAATYEAHPLDQFGVTESEILLGPLSGWNIIHYYLKEISGFEIDEATAKQVAARLQGCGVWHLLALQRQAIALGIIVSDGRAGVWPEAHDDARGVSGRGGAADDRHEQGRRGGRGSPCDGCDFAVETFVETRPGASLQVRSCATLTHRFDDSFLQTMSEPKPIEMLMEAADIAAEEANRATSTEVPSEDFSIPPLLSGPVPEIVAVLPLRGVIVYPLSAIPLRVSQARSIKLIDDAVANKTPIGLIASRNPEKEEPGSDDLYAIGTLATIVRHFKAPDGVVNLIVQGGERIKVVEYTCSDPYITAQIEMLPEVFETTMEIEALRRNISQGFNTMAELLPNLARRAGEHDSGHRRPAPTDVCGGDLHAHGARRCAKVVGDGRACPTRCCTLLQLLNKELEVLELGKKIQTQAQSEMEKVQREYFLREQIKAIQRELGESDEQQIEINEFPREDSQKRHERGGAQRGRT